MAFKPKRKKLTRHKSKKLFRKGVNVNRKNDIDLRPMRGGRRL